MSFFRLYNSSLWSIVCLPLGTEPLRGSGVYSTNCFKNNCSYTRYTTSSPYRGIPLKLISNIKYRIHQAKMHTFPCKIVNFAHSQLHWPESHIVRLWVFTLDRCTCAHNKRWCQCCYRSLTQPPAHQTEVGNPTGSLEHGLLNLNTDTKDTSPFSTLVQTIWFHFLYIFTHTQGNQLFLSYSKIIIFFNMKNIYTSTDTTQVLFSCEHLCKLHLFPSTKENLLWHLVKLDQKWKKEDGRWRNGIYFPCLWTFQKLDFFLPSLENLAS